MFGYVVVVEIIRLYLGERQPAEESTATTPAAATTSGSTTAQHKPALNAAVLEQERREHAESYDRRRALLLGTKQAHNVGLALLSSAMLVGILRSCYVSGKLSRVHSFLCKPFKVGICGRMKLLDSLAEDESHSEHVSGYFY